jgi:hypothetical protein
MGLNRMVAAGTMCLLASASLALSGCPAFLQDFAISPGSGDAGDDGADVGAATDGTSTDGAGSDSSAAGRDGTAPSDAGPGGHDGSAVCGGTCVESPPLGWSLVEVAFSSTMPASCGTAFGGTSWLSYDTLSAPAATCGCSCGAPSGFTCDIDLTPCSWDSSTATCSCGTTSSQTAPNQCVGGFVTGGNPVVVGGQCTPNPSVTVPMTSWGGMARACSPTTTPFSCAGGTCVPAVDPTFSLCIQQSGNVPCPSGSVYSTQHVEYTGKDDTRGCAACTCGSPSGISCGGAWDIYSDGACQSSVNSVGPGFGPCTGYGNSGGSGQYRPAPSGGSCTASTGAPTGSATPTGAMTFCCQ